MAQFVWNLVRSNVRTTVLVTSVCGAIAISRRNSYLNVHAKSEESSKRPDYLRKPDYYMGIALLSAQRSKDPNTQVGACIVNTEERVVGIGYNKMPKSDDSNLPWKRQGEFLETKYPYVCHAVLSAIINMNCCGTQGCTLYTVLFPCNECTKLIAQSGIRKVVYLSDRYKTRQESKTQDQVDAAKRILDVAGIKYLNFDLLSEKERIEIKLKGDSQTTQRDSIQNKFQPDYLDHPREGNLSESDYFMALASLSAQRSKDKVTQVGACIVSEDRKIVGIGYNGMPNYCSDDIMPWGKEGKPLETKGPYVCHAELNAIMNKNRLDLKGCTMYVTLFPCNECAKLIVESGIKEVIYLNDKPDKKEMKASRRILEESEVPCRQYEPQRNFIVDFLKIDNGIETSK